MSLRRSARDSWDLQPLKRLARSTSPDPKIWTKDLRSKSAVAGRRHWDGHLRTQYGGLDLTPTSYIEDAGSAQQSEVQREEHYPERLALTPEPTEPDISRGRALIRDEEQALISPESLPSTGTSPTKTAEFIDVPKSKHVHFDENPVRSMSLPPEIEHSSPIEAPKTVATSILDEFNVEKAERDYLHSTDFPIQFLRPVPNLNQMMTQITPVMGDPGTGFTKFGPQSPQKSVFIEKASRLRDEDPLSQGFLKDRHITPHRPDRLPWSTRTSQKIPTRGHGAEIRLPTAAEMRHDKALAKKWSGRKYSINPNLKTRHLEFDVLQRKINHHELLSLNLSVDARRDALKIGGGEGDIGGSSTQHHKKDSSRSQERARQSSISTSTMSSSRTSTFAAKSKVPKPGMVFPQPLCCKPDCVHCRHIVPQAHTVQMESHEKKVEHKDMISTGGWDTRERRLRAQDIDRSMDAGRYGFGGAMLWRLVRVAARVQVNGEMKDQHAWYVVPDRALGGFF